MDVTCDRCNTEYEFDDALVSEQGTSVRCTQCGHRFKVKRPEAVGGAPEVWIVRTVEGSALEFRALRDLKSAIGAGRVGRDDVLSRGSGRPRRLASIAELEPFFAQSSPLASTSVGIGQSEPSPRSRHVTPAGLGPVKAQRTEHSVAIPLPTRDERSPVSVRVPPPTPEPHSVRGPLETNPFEQEEITHQRNYTRELHSLGELTGPASVDPPTQPERERFPSDTGPKTVLGVAPERRQATPPPPVTTNGAHAPDEDESLKKTTVYGTPGGAVAAASAPAAAGPESEPTTTRRKQAQEQKPATRKTSEPPRSAPLPPPAPAPPPGPPPAPPAVAEQEDAPSSRGEVLPPAPDPAQPTPAATPAPPRTVAASPEEDAAAPRKGRESAQKGRVSLLTPTPAETRYSLSGEESVDIVPSERRTSAVGSRRSAGSIRLIVGVLVGGAMIFLGILFVQRYLPKQTQGSAAADPRVTSFLEAGEKSFAEGDLDGAKDQFVKASALAEADPRVTKALARLSIVRAELTWLELLIAPADDPGREALRRRYSEAVEQAQKLSTRASEVAPDDPEVARLTVDLRRLLGDLAGARKLVDRLAGIDTQPETLVVLGALDLAERNPEWRNVIDRLTKAADREGNLGRARALLVYALARSGDAKRARNELGMLSKLPKPHPLESQLTRFVERSEKGENLANVEDLPSLSPSAAPATSGSAVEPASPSSLKAAQEALAKGNLDQAEKLFQKIVDGDNASVDGLMGLASVARQRGQAKRAIGIYERVVANNPGNLPASIALADLKWDSGDQGGARALYRKALDAGFSGPGADRIRERARGGGALPDSSGSGGVPPDPQPTATTPTATATQEPDVPPWEGTP